MAPIIDFADGHSGKEVVQRVTCGACRIGILGQAIFSRSGAIMKITLDLSVVKRHARA